MFHSLIQAHLFFSVLVQIKNNMIVCDIGVWCKNALLFVNCEYMMKNLVIEVLRKESEFRVVDKRIDCWQ